MDSPARISIYERLRPHLDAADLIERLGIEKVRTLGSEAYCRPLCHESTGGESLQINLHTGRWNCKACQSAGVYGDLIQLVEYVRGNGATPSHGSTQGASESHREAVTWLCEQFGVPFDAERVAGDPALDVVHLFAMAAHRYLLESPAALAWVLEKWGFDEATVSQYGIGFMPSPILPEIAKEAAHPSSRAAFRSSGIGWYTPSGEWRTRFAGRVIFPYLEHGRALYLIGRSTPWTPMLEEGRTPPKYHKLSVHTPERPYISERITNDHLWNEPVMANAEEVGVVEGIADGVAISSLGVPVVSPVTINFNAVDLERFVRKCRERGIRRVWILFDNELSGSGNFAARNTGRKLIESGLSVRIVTLPLGETQLRARGEVLAALGDEEFETFERLDPHKRKTRLAELIPDEAKRAWVLQQVEASKIDGAEWCAAVGAGAAGRFDKLRKSAVDVFDFEVAELAAELDEEEEPVLRANHFDDVVKLAAHLDDRMEREAVAGKIAKAAGRGVSKAEITRRIAARRREFVKPKRKEEAESAKPSRTELAGELALLPPEPEHTTPKAPAAPPSPASSNAPAAPPPPTSEQKSPHEHYAPAREAVARHIEAKTNEETVGEYVAQTIERVMGYTAFRTPDELYLVRGSERVAVGLTNHSPRFLTLLWLASGLTPRKNAHRAYIAAVTYFLERGARESKDVSWSFVEPGTRAVYFPTGDRAGRILKIEPGKVTRTRMADARVPAVSGDEFRPFEYVDEDGGISRAIDLFRWTSISPGDRLVLVYWLACLPVLRRIGVVPIVRIEGGSGSGKTRAVDTVSFLVNGQKSSSVPTAPALASRLAVEMLTVDDNREAIDVTPAFLSILLQATHLGAKEKRKANSDTGTVIERVCGAFLMNGIEPIHDGRAEVGSRILTLRCHPSRRSADSPTNEEALERAALAVRDGFWSEAVRACSDALALDAEHGERIGAEIDELFGSTKIGRLSAYLRIMYLAWVSRLPEHHREHALVAMVDTWRDAFQSIASGSLESLLAEELAVSVLRYVFAHGAAVAERIPGTDEWRAFEDKFVHDATKGDAYLGPMRATQLARLARAAGKELNAPRAITSDLRAGQLERRLLDGLDFLQAAGIEVQVEATAKGRNRFTFRRMLGHRDGRGDDLFPWQDRGDAAAPYAGF